MLQRIGWMVVAMLLATPAWAALEPLAASEIEPTTIEINSADHRLRFLPTGIEVGGAGDSLQIGFVGSTATAPQQQSRQITYPQLWEGIDLIYATDEGILRSNYHLQPGISPAAILLEYNAPLTLKSGGALAIHLPTATFSETPPIAWQVIAGEKIPVEVAFALRGERHLGFEVGAYDHNHPLIIDPLLEGTFRILGDGPNGGTTDQRLVAITHDDNHNLYAVGFTETAWLQSTDPVSPYTGSRDAYIAKFNPTGIMQWHTYLGGSLDDEATAVALDASCLYVAGQTSSDEWSDPTTQQGATSANTSGNLFLTCLNPTSGVAQWVRFIGGPGDDRATAIALDPAADRIYLTGSSTGGNWGEPNLRASLDHNQHEAIFIASLKGSDRSVQWHGFYGSSEGDDYAGGILLDGTTLYVAGTSGDTWGEPIRPFPGAGGIYSNIVVIAITADGSDYQHTFLGGSDDDRASEQQPLALVTQAEGPNHLYVIGNSFSRDWGRATGAPIRPRYSEGNSDLLVAMLEVEALTLGFSPANQVGWYAFYGGDGSDLGTAIYPSAEYPGERLFFVGYGNWAWGDDLPVEEITSSGQNHGVIGHIDATNGELLSFSFHYGSSRKRAYDMALIAPPIGQRLAVVGAHTTSYGSGIDQENQDDGYLAIFSLPGHLALLDGNQRLVERDVWGDPIVDRASLDMGVVDAFSSLPKELTLRNLGMGRLQVFDQEEGAASLYVSKSGVTESAFSVTAQPTFPEHQEDEDFQDGILESGEEASFLLLFDPSDNLTYESEFLLYHDSSIQSHGGEFSLSLSGKGEGSAVPQVWGTDGTLILHGTTQTSMENGTLFANAAAGREGAVHTFTLANDGSASFANETEGEAITVTVHNSGVPNANFTIVSKPENVAGKNLISDPAVEQDLAIQFTPKVSGDHRATVTIEVLKQEAGVDDIRYSFTVAGSASGPDIWLSGNNNDILQNTAPTVVNHTDFEKVNQHTSRIRTYTITNFGNSPLTVQPLSSDPFGTDNAFSLQQNIAKTELNSGESTTFQIVFAPLAVKTYSGEVTVSSDDPSKGTFVFMIEGEGLAANPAMSVTYEGKAVTSGSTIALGSQLLARTLERTFTLTNNGPAGSSLEISGITASGDFAFVGDPPPAIASGASANFTIAFTPTQTGTRTGEVTISSNDPEQGSFAFTASGTGEKGKITLDKSHLTVRERDTDYQQVMVTLPSPPLHEVTMAFSLSKNGEIAVATEDSGGLTFTPDGSLTKWLRVSSMNTPELTIDQTITVHGTTTTSDPAYSGVHPAALTVTKRKRYYSDDCSEQPSLAITVATGETKVCRLSSGTLDLSGTTVQPGGQAMFIAPAVRTSGVTFASGATVILGTHHEALDLSESTIISEGRPAN